MKINLPRPGGATFEVHPGDAVAYEQGGRWFRGSFERIDSKGDAVVAMRCSAHSTPANIVLPVSSMRIRPPGQDDVGALEAVPRQVASEAHAPIPMILTCPSCSTRHIDEGEFATKPHHTHACQSCGMCWRPAIVATCGVQFLPGFKNEVKS